MTTVDDSNGSLLRHVAGGRAELVVEQGEGVPSPVVNTYSVSRQRSRPALARSSACRSPWTRSTWTQIGGSGTVRVERRVLVGSSRSSASTRWSPNLDRHEVAVADEVVDLGPTDVFAELVSSGVGARMFRPSALRDSIAEGAPVGARHEPVLHAVVENWRDDPELAAHSGSR